MNSNYEQDGISLIEILEVLIKRKKIILVTSIIFMLGSLAFALSPLNEKELQFDAVSSIAIIYEYKTPENPEEIGEGFVMYQDRMNNNIIPTIKAYANSLSLIGSIISDLDLRDNEGEALKTRKLAKDIKIENSGSSLITITVKYNDEELTAAIANLIPKKLIEMAMLNENLRNYDIMIIDEAIVSEIEHSSGKPLVLAIGTILGIILGIFIVFALEYLNKNVRNKRDILYYGIEVDLEGKHITSSSFSNHLMNHIYLLDMEKYYLSLDKDAFSMNSLEILLNNISKSEENLKILDFTGVLKGIYKGSLNIEDMSDAINNHINFKKIMQTFEMKVESKLLIISFGDLELFEILSKLSDSSLVVIQKGKTERKYVEDLSNIKTKYDSDIRVILI